MPRHWINCWVFLRVCGLLLVGAIFTVAAAWGPAVRFWLMDRDYSEHSVATNRELRWWRATIAPKVSHDPAYVRRVPSCPAGSDAVSMHWAGGSSWAAAYRCRFGLPLRSLGYNSWMVNDPLGDSGWHFSWYWSFDVTRRRRTATIHLPFTPILSGFAIDTLVFAAVFAIVLNGWRRIIRTRRLKRGRCPDCSYPIGTSAVCTECGRALPPTPIRC